MAARTPVTDGDPAHPRPARDFADGALIGAVKSGAVAAGTLDHGQHLRIAWMAAREPSLAAALEALCPTIRAFAAHAGKPDIYHETITVGLLVLIRERVLSEGCGADFEGFLARNEDLMDWKALLRRHWTDDVLGSDRARAVFVLPRPLGL